MPPERASLWDIQIAIINPPFRRGVYYDLSGLLGLILSTMYSLIVKLTVGDAGIRVEN